MTAPSTLVPTLDLLVRVGCFVAYETTVPTPIVLNVRPRRSRRQWVQQERLTLPAVCPPEETEDAYGNFVTRVVLAPGRTEIRHDALVAVSSRPESHEGDLTPTPPGDLPLDVLRFALPSRYCDSDRLLNFAWEHFGQVPHGIERVRAICDWVHQHIAYRFGSGQSITSALDIIHNGYGVCRDFAHVGIALCRAFNIPARYVSGHLPDIGCLDAGGAMDFHASFEAFLGGRWRTFDPRFNVPRIGRITIANGLDAVDTAFATVYGDARLAWFEVWAYQVAPGAISLGDPVDLAKRVDGSFEVRIPT